MKIKQSLPINAKASLSGASPRQSDMCEVPVQQSKRDQEFIKAMNELTEKAGLLSDDPWFGGI